MASVSVLSVSKRKNKSNNYCCVPQCNSYYSDEISMHGFPKYNESLRKAWQIRLKIGKPISVYMKVCSKHFSKDDFILPDYVNKRRVLKKHACPTKNLPVVLHQKSPSVKTIKNKLDRGDIIRRRYLKTKFKKQIQEIPKNQISSAEIEAATALIELYNKKSLH